MQEIAEVVGVDEKTIRNETTGIFTKLENFRKNSAEFQDSEFEVPIYNVWAFW